MVNLLKVRIVLEMTSINNERLLLCSYELETGEEAEERR